ncbi:unnamed protein product [Rotaria sp. Silwood2]|nr:unnamed protein product [Rotaria sp. Silwood2]CAF3174094.1 unnamed protein product [Rotaria sp. Silwood2]CAF3249490.1 unnamed protein product [Rotaria sp. Silwood2]CAF4085853.1 unnamed protein product [Rotaria sp. Silwood2]CAF4408293.1 unnamed protein product [Rotaria sp. Silwood2]
MLKLNKKVLSDFGLDIPDVIMTGLSNELKEKTIQQSIKPSNQTSKHLNKRKNISNLNYEEVKQEYLQQQEQIEILQAKIRRLEHVLKLKDMIINELLTILQHKQPNH